MAPAAFAYFEALMDERIRTELALLKEDAASFWTRLVVVLDGAEPNDAALQEELRDVSREMLKLSLRLTKIASYLPDRRG
jgi:hypothetical protein